MSAAGVPPRAAAVVIGSGAFGSATAYHLARMRPAPGRRGWRRARACACRWCRCVISSWSPSPLPALQPIVRMVEASVYVRHEQGGLLFGGYEDAPRVVDAARLPPAFQIADLPLDLSVLRALIDEVGAHFPALRTARVAVHRGGLPTMTADGRPLLGRVPGLEGLFVASGCCVGGLGLSPAAGRALADLIVDGTSDPDLSPLSVERFRGRLEDGAALEAACVAQYARRYIR